MRASLMFFLDQSKLAILDVLRGSTLVATQCFPTAVDFVQNSVAARCLTLRSDDAETHYRRIIIKPLKLPIPKGPPGVCVSTVSIVCSRDGHVLTRAGPRNLINPR
jgi:hypothetical protein